jgi:hypothetical protein
LPRLHQLVYCSRAADGVDDTAVARIVATAQRVNSVQGITGLLVWGGGMFFQWREGPRVAITRLMGSIRRDPRHERVVILSETEEVRERIFGSPLATSARCCRTRWPARRTPRARRRCA